MKHERPDAADIRTRAAQLRLWALGAMAWLVELFGEASPIGACLARALRADLGDAERLALACAVVLAPPPVRGRRGGWRPCADARRDRKGSALRALTRGLLAPLRRCDLRARLARLDAFLSDIDRAAATIAHRFARGARKSFAAGERACDRAAEAPDCNCVRLLAHDTS